MNSHSSFTSLLLLAVLQYAAPQAAASDASPASLAVNTGSREEVRNFYNAVYFASENAPMGWAGSATNCAAGATTAAYRDAVALRINLFRALAGVPAAITLNDIYNGKAQQAALMMSANDQLTHYPPTSWLCYGADGAEAAGHSNLSLGEAGADAVTGQIRENGDNAAVAHRRWLLYPQTQEMGTGNVAGDANHAAANAVWVLDGHLRDARPATRDGFVAWPPPGYIPYPLAFARWSLSYPNADFSAARVTMGRSGVNVPVTLEAVSDGSGENTLVWRPSDPLLTDPTPLADGDATFSVSVQGVRLGGQTRTFAYDVSLFDPMRAGPDSVLPEVLGGSQPSNGYDNPYAIGGALPAADGYEWLYATSTAYGAVQGAENGLGDMVAATSPGYAPITDISVASGAKAYRLMHSQFENQTLTLDKLLVPGPQGRLNFQSLLGLAHEGENATVQISLDNGATWKTLYSQKGNEDGSSETAFTLHSLSLGDFSGRPVRVRFNYQVPDTGLYYNSGSSVGWFLDEIAFEDATVLETSAIAPADANGYFTFRPPAPGNYMLAARGTVHGHPLEFGHARMVSTTDEPPSTATPTVDAGSDQTVKVGAKVSLDGSGSTDPDQGPRPLAYQWTQTGGPGVDLDDAATVAPSFIPTQPGTYTFSLMVGDGLATSAEDTVSVTVEDVPIQLISPNGGETLKIKTRQSLHWYASSTLVNTQKLLAVRYSKNDGRSWKTVKVTRAYVGSVRWKPKRADRSTQGRLQICMVLNAKLMCDTSDGNFTIQR
jgi:hypothetical protein